MVEVVECIRDVVENGRYRAAGEKWESGLGPEISPVEKK